VLAAPAAIVRRLRNDAAAEPGLVVTDMAAIAQRTNVYDEYLAALATSDDLSYYAVSLLGPRPAVERLTGRLPLLR
jgi:pimeloyl-CoA synthetase